MMKDFTYHKVSSSTVSIHFDESKCIGCNRCVEACQIDVLMPGDKTPKVVWPGECWYCGACVMECPIEGAISFRHPLMNQARFISKEELNK